MSLVSIEHPSILLTVATGDGNPAAAAQLKNDFADAKLPLKQISVNKSALVTKVWHRGMTKKHTYNESLRSSPLALMLGAAMSLEALVQMPRDHSRTLLLVQEHPLTLFALFPSYARALFGEIIQIVPDAAPKKSARLLASPLRDIFTFAVWNKSTQSSLNTEGFRTILTSPPIAHKPFSNHRYNAIKESGSGIHPTFLKIAKQNINPHLPLLHVTPKEEIWSHPSGATHRYSRSSLTETYQYLARASALATYPSEMVGLLASSLAQGWSGDVTFFDPRGAHEDYNLSTFQKFNYPYSQIHLDGTITAHNVHSNFSPVDVRTQLGHTSLVKILKES